MNAALFAVALTALGAGPARPRLIVLDLAGSAGIDAAAISTLTATVAAEVDRRGVFEVFTSRELASVLGLERQKALLGCSEGASCLAELSGALGADLVLSGTIARLGDAWTLTLQTVDARSSRSIGRAVRIAPNLDDFASTLPLAVAEATGLPAPQLPSRALPVTAFAVGGSLIIAGGLVGALGLLKERELVSELSIADTRQGPLRPVSAYQQDLALVRTEKTLGLVGLAAGAALVAGGVVMFALSSSPSVAHVALVPAPGGLAVVGSF
jgi:hypothetical protein